MSTTAPEMKVTAVASWYGSNRMLAARVGCELAGCEWVGIPFAGGMCELAHIGARTINVNDLHRHVINLAHVMADPKLGPALYRQVRRAAFHPGELAFAQVRCRDRECWRGDADKLFATGNSDRSFDGPNLEWAVDYFIVAWMIRHGTAGTPGEFTGGVSTRWNSGGGDSAAHFNGAVASIAAWRRLLRRCNFTTLDFLEFLSKCKDRAKHGIYCDAPFPGAGDAYTHKFSTEQHRLLADRLSEFNSARVVVRYYDVPLIRELYPESQWTWILQAGRKQTNDAAPEALILNGPSLAKAVA